MNPIRSSNVPVTLPPRLHSEIRSLAKEIGRTQAAVMRDSITYGLPRLREAHRFALGKSAQPAARK